MGRTLSFLSTFRSPPRSYFFFFNDTATTEIYTLSLHDALPILRRFGNKVYYGDASRLELLESAQARDAKLLDRKSTRLNSSHSQISYAVFCLKKKNKPRPRAHTSLPGRRTTTACIHRTQQCTTA